VVVVSDLNKNIGRSTDLAKKKAQIGGFAYPYSPPSFSDWIVRENLHGFSFTSLRDIASSKAIDIVYTTRKIISAYMKGLSKYRGMAFFFLKCLFLVWRY